MASESRARKAFTQASAECQEVIKHVLRHEREVMHLQRRTEIHAKIYDTIKKVVR